MVILELVSHHCTVNTGCWKHWETGAQGARSTGHQEVGGGLGGARISGTGDHGGTGTTGGVEGLGHCNLL